MTFGKSAIQSALLLFVLVQGSSALAHPLEGIWHDPTHRSFYWYDYQFDQSYLKFTEEGLKWIRTIGKDSVIADRKVGTGMRYGADYIEIMRNGILGVSGRYKFSITDGVLRFCHQLKVGDEFQDCDLTHSQAFVRMQSEPEFLTDYALPNYHAKFTFQLNEEPVQTAILSTKEFFKEARFESLMEQQAFSRVGSVERPSYYGTCNSVKYYVGNAKGVLRSLGDTTNPENYSVFFGMPSLGDPDEMNAELAPLSLSTPIERVKTYPGNCTLRLKIELLPN